MTAHYKLQVNMVSLKGSLLCGLPKLTVAPVKFCMPPYTAFDPFVLFPS
jgi:hypothetical protein